MVPLFIADYKSGLFTARDQWIAPSEAFPRLNNVRVHRGKIQKRDGFKIFGYFPTRIESSGTSVTLTWADDGSDNVEVTTSAVHGLSTGDAVIFQGVTGNGSSNLANNKFFVTVTSTTVFTLDNITWSGLHATPAPSGGTLDQIKSLSKNGEIADGGISNTNPGIITTKSAHSLSTGDRVLITGDFQNSISGGNTGSLDGAVSTVSVLTTATFVLDQIETTDLGTHTSGGDIATISTSNNNAIVGLGERFKDEADNEFVAVNQRRLAKYDASLSSFTPVVHNTLSAADVFSGDNDEFFQITNAFSRIWITNFKDRPQTYDGTTFDHADFDIDNDSSNEITRVRFIFQYNRRVVLLYTVEGGSGFPQRARWSRIDFGTGSTNEWDDQADDTNAGSLDADTDEEIISAGFLKDKLIVFFERSIWSLEKTGSFDPPFRWVKIAENPGPFGSPFGIVGHGEFLWSIGQGGVIATDGYRIQQADPTIPYFEDEISKGDFDTVFAFKDVARRETWIAYASNATDPNNKIKVFDYENNTWTEYDIAMNVASEFTGALVARTWSTFNVYPDHIWQNVNHRWDEFKAPRGDPKIVFGNDQGIIYRAHEGTSDAGAKVEAVVEIMRLNPFKEQSGAAHLVYVDFIFTEHPGTDLTVEFYHDFEEQPYALQTLSLASDTGRDSGKIWKRVYVNSIANSHKIRLFDTSQGEPFTNHGMIFWFKKSGRFEQL